MLHSNIPTAHNYYYVYFTGATLPLAPLPYRNLLG